MVEALKSHCIRKYAYVIVNWNNVQVNVVNVTTSNGRTKVPLTKDSKSLYY